MKILQTPNSQYATRSDYANRVFSVLRTINKYIPQQYDRMSSGNKSIPSQKSPEQRQAPQAVQQTPQLSAMKAPTPSGVSVNNVTPPNVLGTQQSTQQNIVAPKSNQAQSVPTPQIGQQVSQTPQVAQVGQVPPTNTNKTTNANKPLSDDEIFNKRQREDMQESGMGEGVSTGEYIDTPNVDAEKKTNTNTSTSTNTNTGTNKSLSDDEIFNMRQEEDMRESGMGEGAPTGNSTDTTNIEKESFVDNASTSTPLEKKESNVSSSVGVNNTPTPQAVAPQTVVPQAVPPQSNNYTPSPTPQPFSGLNLDGKVTQTISEVRPVEVPSDVFDKDQILNSILTNGYASTFKKNTPEPDAKTLENIEKSRKIKENSAVLAETLRVLSDIGSASAGGNVYQRNNKDVETINTKAEADKDKYQAKLDDYNTKLLNAILQDKGLMLDRYKSLLDTYGSSKVVNKIEPEIEEAPVITPNNNRKFVYRDYNPTTNKYDTKYYEIEGGENGYDNFKREAIVTIINNDTITKYLAQLFQEEVDVIKNILKGKNVDSNGNNIQYDPNIIESLIGAAVKQYPNNFGINARMQPVMTTPPSQTTRVQDYIIGGGNNQQGRQQNSQNNSQRNNQSGANFD
jgi:hypothetical protein